ncbi:hypothetical protein LB465_02885 [Salegentibacter sp. LM13S]|uniref:hypothetical protein n=1 Tax=Salegentibacter lacus TaxID=2873599 RepID=UPI001CCCA703|nr:hypothetical protein [Salegentibacter lacus]MBZ9629711.1 hypothetical protein [Salegentibacter lacus]
MKKLIFSLLLVLSFISCCQDEIINTYTIPENAKNRIPFDQNSTLNYVNEQDASFSASAIQKRIIVNTERNGQHSCDLTGFEVLKSSVFINTFDFGFEFILEINQNEDLLFKVKRYWENGGYQIYTTECGQPNYDPEGPFTDIEINGYSFSNILILKVVVFLS